MFGPSSAALVVFSPLAVPTLTVRSFLVQLSVVAVLWIGLYALNCWLFNCLAFSEQVCWVFLPAALRMVAVLLAGWVGAAGILLGGLATGLYFFGLGDPSYVLFIAAISALAPTAALIACGRFLKTQMNLAGLSAKNLLTLSAVAAGFTSMMYNAYFVMLGKVDAVVSSAGAMFVGDLVGTLIVLYGAKLALHTLTSKSATGAT